MKIKLTKPKNKLVPFDKTHDVNITADWGFMAPTLCDEIVGGSKVSFQANTFARMSPLVAPTFGRAIVKHYAYYVPFTDVQMNYENLLSGTTYNGGDVSYIPSQVFSTHNAHLSSILWDMTFGLITVYARSSNRINRSPVPFTEELQTELRTYLSGPSWVSFGPTYSKESDSNPFNADFVIPTVNYIFCLRLNSNGKHLRKIFEGLGYRLNLNDIKLRSFLPLLAYYKAWFDMFAVKREVNWQQTEAYKIIQSISLNNYMSTQDEIDTLKFYQDLVDCYFVENPNYFTAHQNKLNYMQTDTSISYVQQGDLSRGIEFQEANLVGSNNYFSVAPRIHVFDLARQLVKFVNKNNAIGSRIAAYFAAHGLGDVDDNKDTNFVGSCSFHCDFDSVMSTSDTAGMEDGKPVGSSLGEYAGSGTASGSSDKFTLHARRSGYFIILTTVIPRCGFIQGVAPYLDHISRFQFWHPEFEAKFMQITDKSSVFGMEDVKRGIRSDGAFGVIPSYSEYKFRSNYAGGDLTLRSTRLSMLPYILDRWFTTSELIKTYEDDAQWRYIFQEPIIPSVNDEMRYIGRSELYGNFNRIFQQYDEDDDAFAPNDPFILHNLFNYQVMQPMLPLKSSWDTFDGEDGTMTIEKA